MTKKSIKQQSLEHYDRMIEVAKDFDSDIPRVSRIQFEDFCGEVWTSEHCAYCRKVLAVPYEFKIDNPCAPCSLDHEDGCCGGCWVKINESNTNKEILKALQDTRKYIEIHGTENGLKEKYDE